MIPVLRNRTALTSRVSRMYKPNHKRQYPTGDQEYRFGGRARAAQHPHEEDADADFGEDEAEVEEYAGDEVPFYGGADLRGGQREDVTTPAGGDAYAPACGGGDC